MDKKESGFAVLLWNESDSLRQIKTSHLSAFLAQRRNTNCKKNELEKTPILMAVDSIGGSGIHLILFPEILWAPVNIDILKILLIIYITFLKKRFLPAGLAILICDIFNA
jgi:hypothetical protein